MTQQANYRHTLYCQDLEEEILFDLICLAETDDMIVHIVRREKLNTICLYFVVLFQLKYIWFCWTVMKKTD